MEVTVAIATKGRPREAGVLLEHLGRQTRRPDRVLVVGAGPDDIAFGFDADTVPLAIHAWVAPRAGLTIQRNEAVRWLRDRALIQPGALVVFFDDDFRPSDTWIERCVALFQVEPDLVGMTGQVLADGIHGYAISEADAARFIAGELPPRAHWASGKRRATTSVYGCNMAFAARVMNACLFDESLPLYGWQEDRDMTGQARKLGQVVFAPDCVGVHLGASGARTSGVRLGYSQVANMIYLARKGTVEWSIAARFLLSSLAANIVRTIFKTRDVDYIGRLRGNWIALFDLARGRCEPNKILKLGSRL
jgi:glycosyltransferase involved in cell wall biosynthesis